MEAYVASSFSVNVQSDFCATLCMIAGGADGAQLTRAARVLSDRRLFT
jgi:hypothetical protein